MTIESVLGSLRELIRNPTSNLAATSLGFAIVVVVILILIMIALIALVPRAEKESGPDSETPAEPDNEATVTHDEAPAVATPPESRPRFGGRFGGLKRAPLIVALALIAIVATYVASGTVEYCSTTCHTMVEPGDTWAASAHSTTRCVRCHEGSFVDAISARTRHAAAELTGSSAFTLREAVSSRRCLECHSAILERTVTSSRGVRVEHAHIVAAGTDCVRCHESAGHTAGPPTRRGTMSDCLRCHDGEQALAGCFVCHEGDVAKAALAKRAFGKTTLPQPRCGGCHEQDSCDACHGLRMPHPDDYADPHQHARAGAFDGREKLCYRCHTKNDCGQCHTNLDSGHPANWKSAHKQSARTEGTGYCLSCHKTKDFCGICHQ